MTQILTNPHSGSLAPSRALSDLAMTNFSTGIDLPAILCLCFGTSLLQKRTHKCLLFDQIYNNNKL